MSDTTPKTTKAGSLKKTKKPDKQYWEKVAENLKELERNDLLKGSEFYEEPITEEEPIPEKKK